MVILRKIISGNKVNINKTQTHNKRTRDTIHKTSNSDMDVRPDF